MGGICELTVKAVWGNELGQGIGLTGKNPFIPLADVGGLLKDRFLSKTANCF